MGRDHRPTRAGRRKLSPMESPRVGHSRRAFGRDSRAARPKESLTRMRRPHYIAAISIVHPDPTGQLRRAAHLSMRNLSFGFFDDCGLPREARILIFYSFE